MHVLCCDICVDVSDCSSHYKSDGQPRMNKYVKGKHDHPGSDDALVIPAVTVLAFGTFLSTPR